MSFPALDTNVLYGSRLNDLLLRLAFLLDQLDLFPGLVVAALRELVSIYETLPVTMEQLLQSLARVGVPKFAHEVPRYL